MKSNSIRSPPVSLIFLASEACCGEPEDVIVIVGVDALLAVAGEDPVMASVEEDHALVRLPARWFGSLRIPKNLSRALKHVKYAECGVWGKRV